jgi:MtrB/PioB family decaheme-associated outer membrane protein
VREAKLQEFREFPNGAYLDHFLVRGPIGGFTGTAWGSNAFLEQQKLGLALNKGLRWQLDARYQQTPHKFSLIARSPFVQTAPGVYSLSDSLQRANQENPGGAFVGTMNAALAVAPNIPLEHRTDLKKFRLRARPDAGWQIALAGEQRARVGTKAYGMSFGFSNANEVVEPIHQRMTDVSLAANYHKSKVAFRSLVGYSTFDNRIDALVVDNPRRWTDSPTAGSSRGRIDLYPDNSAVRGQVDLALNLARSTAFTGSFGVARMRQDDDWLPFTINSAIPQASLDSLYGSVTARSTGATAVRWSHSSRLSHRFSNQVKGDAHLRWQKYDNQTEEFPFRGVVQYDQSLVRDTVGFINHPFGNEQLSAGSDWNFRLTDHLHIGAGYDRKWRHHSLREVELDKEHVVHARAAYDAESGLYAGLGWTFGARRLDQFHEAEYRRADAPDTVFLENPALRRFDVADRNRHDVEGEIGWVLSDQLDVSIGGQLADNDYGESELGLQRDQRWTLIGQATARPTSSWDLTGGYGFGRGDTDQASQERSATSQLPITTANPDSGNSWTARIRDRNDFGFVQSTWRVVPRTFTFTTSYWVSRDQASYLLDNETNTAVDLPDTYYLRQEGRVEGRFRLNDGTELIGRYGYDTWKVNDFAAKDIPLLGVANNAAVAIYLGASLQNYTAHSISFAVSRRF